MCNHIMLHIHRRKIHMKFNEKNNKSKKNNIFEKNIKRSEIEPKKAVIFLKSFYTFCSLDRELSFDSLFVLIQEC